MKEMTSPTPTGQRAHSRRHVLTKMVASAAAYGVASGFCTSSNAAIPPSSSSQAETNADSSHVAPGIILDHASTSWAKIRNDINSSSNERQDNYAALQQLVEDKKYLTIDTPLSVSQPIKLNMKNQFIEGCSEGIITPLAGMQSSYLLELHGDATRLHGLVLDNPLLLKTARGDRQGGVMIVAHYCEVSECYFYRMLQSVVAQASFGAWGTKIVNNWFLECLGAGPGMSDLHSNLGEDRGDAVSVWGSGTIVSGNHAWLKEGEDARIAFHAEGLPNTPRIKRDSDHKDIIFMNNMAQGAFRRHFAFENITNGISVGNVSMGGSTWWGESYTQCKNVIAENTIRFTVGTDNKNGNAWHPVKAGIAVLNFNEAVKISSSVMLGNGVQASGFAIASQIGDHDITLSGNMINEGSVNNVAVNLNKPKSVRIFNLHTRGFGRAVSLAATEKTTFSSSNCIHECAGTDDGLKVTHGSGSSITINGDSYSGVKRGFTIANFQHVSISNTRVEAKDHFAVLNGISQQLSVTDNIVTGDTKLALQFTGNLSPNLSWQITNNIGISSQLAWNEAQVKSLHSALNQRSKYAGKAIVMADQRLLVALGDAPEAPWFSVTEQSTLIPR